MRCRKSNRMPGYDYSAPGYYFVTICVKDRLPLLGKIERDCRCRSRPDLSNYGEIVKQQWFWLGEQYKYIKLDEFVVMPDHVHGIVVINECNMIDESPVGTERIAGTGRDLPLRRIFKIKPLHEIIGALKTTSSRRIHNAGCHEFRWQRSFYDRIIRNDKELYYIRNYIKTNPSGY